MKHILSMMMITLLLTVSGIFSTGVYAAMKGFEGEHAITDPEKVIEVFVEFVTPPVTVLQAMYEGRWPMTPGIVFEDGVSFEEMALAAHGRFRQELQIMGITEYEILDEVYRVTNGVYMRVRGGMVEQIAELPEVLEVTPHIVPSLPCLPGCDCPECYDTGFGPVPNTGVPRITEAIMAMFAFLAISIASWVYIRTCGQ
ncbi:MAG: hypothetical protein FWF79_05410 [Defluviitaleaceae bacterium]|nr:hypothetical protein [Defluviitaleaceae bacterium]